MAKRTVDTNFTDQDIARSTERCFYSSNQDPKEIFYHYDPPPEATVTSEEGNTDSNISIASGTAVPVKAEAPAPITSITSAASVADVPIVAKDIVRSLVAHKLRKELEKVSEDKSIKDLCGGKSTLQNELLGDFGNEFGDMPDSAEDLPLGALADAISAKFSGNMGKQTTSIVGKMISAKMPAGFTQSAIRKHLEDTWGLGPSRQSAVLLYSITSEPRSRLPSTEEARKHFDAIAQQYAKSSGFTIGLSASSDSATTQTAAVVDLAHLNILKEEQRKVALQQFKVLANHLNIDYLNETKIMELKDQHIDFQERLDLWSSEFANDFQSGITPSFDPKKARRFASPWNLVRQDILCLYHDAIQGRVDLASLDVDQECLHIANRADKSVRTLLTNLTNMSLSCHGSGEGFAPLGQKLLSAVSSALGQPPVYRFVCSTTAPKTTLSPGGKIEYKEVRRTCYSRQVQYLELLRQGRLDPVSETKVPYVHLKRLQASTWKVDALMTETFLECLEMGMKDGLSFAGKNILLTGAGPGSIGAKVLRGLLMGGARVIVTTSRPPSSRAQYYQDLYSATGAQGSELLLLPFNQGSKQDCEALVDYIYSDSGLQRNLDYVIPFAAIPEVGFEIDGLEARSELAHRMMLTNVLRILGQVVRNKHQRHIITRPTQVLIPLSPNHGTFGGDGLYSESKLGLEGLLARFHSESWSDYLIVCGASIGWTRGTGLMSGNDIVAETIESHGVLTFSQEEMAYNLLALMTTPIFQICENEPIFADLNGGLHLLEGLKDLLFEARTRLIAAADIRKALKEEDLREESMLNPLHDGIPLETEAANIMPRSSLRIGFPSLPDFDKSLAPLQHLQGMVDPSSTIVVVGFSELGPWGSARTRWQMESAGGFNQAGYIEMAWMMNLIKHFDGEIKGAHYVGWVDAKSGETIHDSQMAETYHSQIHDHSGVRLVEPSLFGGYDPNRKEYLHEVAIDEELPEFDATQATAEAFMLRHGENAVIRKVENSDEFRVRIKKGAHMLIPKAIPFDGLVAGQIPTGWNPLKYGIPEDIISQVDPVTLYALCCASEALYSAGIMEPLEIYKHIHISELGNFIGSMMGGTTKTRNMYKDQYLDKPVQGDVLQETFLSNTAAWINMLLLGAAGPIKTPTGACATGIESLDSGCESILSGKIKMCFVGGTDDFQEEESYAFSTMNATANAREQLRIGRSPNEMSRPTTESRSGFVESQGCGVQIITTAAMAVEMGLPIYAIIASSTMAADKISRSVPAPGQGILSYARENSDAALSPLLDINYRREQMELCIGSIHRWGNVMLRKPLSELARTPPVIDAGPLEQSGVDLSISTATIKATVEARIQGARRLWGNDFRVQAPNISPLRASLAVWGLTVNDISVASLHATSTKANDKNEPDIINKQMMHLGRDPGNPILAICQKSLTGHPKAPAAAFMLNGCLQVLDTGIVPGNRNADTVDDKLRDFEHLIFPNKSIQTGDVKAFSLTSFGFGQKGGQVIGVAAKFFLASLSRDAYKEYASKVANRKKLADRAYTKAVITNSVFKAKTSTPYAPSEESTVLLDPFARVSEDSSRNLHFDRANVHRDYTEDDVETPERSSTPIRKNASLVESASITKAWIEHITSQNQGSSISVGMDVEEVDKFNSDNKVFLDRNFTEAEQALAHQSPDPRSTFAGKWSAKEAVFKSFGISSKGAGAAMKDIEILSDRGIPVAKVSNLRISAIVQSQHGRRTC